ncbi:hypothetical protein Taro_047298 [Colocasia esculenta]|uniref:Uncharacterized protein n=1 Tax=Colocasia esculenta TaxID=4460 RepID=A0A843X0Q0_COLES|nr:hypothetical protein [Colocasia esculenta]
MQVITEEERDARGDKVAAKYSFIQQIYKSRNRSAAKGKYLKRSATARVSNVKRNMCISICSNIYLPAVKDRCNSSNVYKEGVAICSNTWEGERVTVVVGICKRTGAVAMVKVAVETCNSMAEEGKGMVGVETYSSRVVEVREMEEVVTCSSMEVVAMVKEEETEMEEGVNCNGTVAAVTVKEAAAICNGREAEVKVTAEAVSYSGTVEEVTAKEAEGTCSGKVGEVKEMAAAEIGSDRVVEAKHTHHGGGQANRHREQEEAGQVPRPAKAGHGSSSTAAATLPNGDRCRYVYSDPCLASQSQAVRCMVKGASSPLYRDLWTLMLKKGYHSLMQIASCITTTRE